MLLNVHGLTIIKINTDELIITVHQAQVPVALNRRKNKDYISELRLC